MGSAESTPVVPTRTISRRERRAPREAIVSFDEKFDALRIDHADSKSVERIIFPSGGNSEHVDAATTQDYVLKVLKDPKNRLGLSALSANNPASILEKPSTLIRDTQYFNVKIPFEGSPVTNQRSSGRCWIFAATNVFRVAIQQKYNIKSFELSQAYLFFWDKVEKANYFLESILDTLDEDVDSRLISALNASPVGDGGQWV